MSGNSACGSVKTPGSANRSRLASMAHARALARRAKQASAELAEFSQEHLEDLRVIFRIRCCPIKGLYSNLIPELSQPAFE